MKQLVKRLSEKESKIQVNQPEKTVDALKKRIESNTLHVLFKETDTEIGIKLDPENCDYSKANFAKKTGKIQFQGAVTLNYEKVRCIASVNLSTMAGKGRLELIEDEAEYKRIIWS